MLARQRQEDIARLVRQHGSIRVSALTERFDVSHMTIRRDLEALARRGRLDKVHGGAVAAPPGGDGEPAFAEKRSRQVPAKEAIAVAAARLVTPGSAIGMTAGTTTWTLARRLLDVPDLTVVTNSVQVAQILHTGRRRTRTVVLTGGVRTPSDALVGPVAVAALRTLHVDVLFMGVHGMDARTGFSTPNPDEAETNRAMCRSARRTVVLADHTKWNATGLAGIAPLGAADTLVTDSGIDGGGRAALERGVGELIVVEPSRSAPRAVSLRPPALPRPTEGAPT
ncbi:DeoR/GlpR family DNA-binding transcription regulator [Streptomyces pilosus]|uniref:DeoR family transcriptional regulator n=1 Tax=Streptomyces pilosus TaxID=28893 RepID=A0A918EV67_9ACTN|nr:DeoR/GlpR family DNA-binding transcription regulator [Streptomyces pilosus]GGQ67017.1 DeoR family transcriptional regulator [Streptomyces pilosus]GGV53631.1 DeoR family transcriptional regulator [Streptomyces pilosus]